MQEVQAKRSRHAADSSIDGQPHDREQCAASDRASIQAALQRQAGSLEWQCQQSSPVSIASVGCASAHVLLAPIAHPLGTMASRSPDRAELTGQQPGEEAEHSEAAASDLPQLRVTVQWSCKEPAGREDITHNLRECTSAQSTLAAPVHSPRCQILTEPQIPEDATLEFAAMAGTFPITLMSSFHETVRSQCLAPLRQLLMMCLPAQHGRHLWLRCMYTCKPATRSCCMSSLFVAHPLEPSGVHPGSLQHRSQVRHSDAAC